MNPQALLDVLINTSVYSEPASQIHHDLIPKVWHEIVLANTGVSFDQSSLVLDVGAGDGFAMELFTKSGLTSIGVNYTDADVKACRDKGLCCQQADMHELSKIGSLCFDLVWARHILEHSPFPMLALNEIHQVLKPGGWLYAEMPAPGTACAHESNPNHFSVFPRSCWGNLLSRAGFILTKEVNWEFTTLAGPDTYYSFLCRKE